MSKRQTNVIVALTGDRLLTVSLFDVSINTDVFEAWLHRFLLPVLSNGAFVVMDNATFHTSERIQKAVEAVLTASFNIFRHILLNLNSIEHKWA